MTVPKIRFRLGCWLFFFPAVVHLPFLLWLSFLSVRGNHGNYSVAFWKVKAWISCCGGCHSCQECRRAFPLLLVWQCKRSLPATIWMLGQNFIFDKKKRLLGLFNFKRFWWNCVANGKIHLRSWYKMPSKLLSCIDFLYKVVHKLVVYLYSFHNFVFLQLLKGKTKTKKWLLLKLCSSFLFELKNWSSYLESVQTSHNCLFPECTLLGIFDIRFPSHFSIFVNMKLEPYLGMNQKFNNRLSRFVDPGCFYTFLKRNPPDILSLRSTSQSSVDTIFFGFFFRNSSHR